MTKNKKTERYQQYAGSVQNLLTFEQYATKKGISLKTVYNHIKAGLIRPVIIGKSKFIAIQ